MKVRRCSIGNYPMTVAIKNNNKTPLVVPQAVRRQARFKSGQELEFKASGGVITILPKLPSADEEYTPEQRRIVDARLAAAEEDIKAGRVHGPFTAKQASGFIEQLAKRRAAKKSTRTRRSYEK
jgi:bifunctional DNA-binding transcriptional regulator/antitoxin component of YhaV-PrlF toxin-antitoxin module